MTVRAAASSPVRCAMGPVLAALLAVAVQSLAGCGAETATLPPELLGTWCVTDGKTFDVVRIGRRSIKVPGVNPVYELYRYRAGDVPQLIGAGDATWTNDGPDSADGEFLSSSWSWLPSAATDDGTDGPMTARVWGYSRTQATMQVPTSTNPWAFQRLTMRRVDELPGRDAKTCEDGGGGTASLVVEGGDGDPGALKLIWATSLQAEAVRIHGRIAARGPIAAVWRTWGDTLVAVSQLDGSGHHRWTKTTPTDPDAPEPSVTVHPGGRTVASWGYSTPFTVDKRAIGSWGDGSRSAAMASFGLTGTLQWMRHAGGPGGATSVPAVKLDSRGFLFAGVESFADPLYIAPTGPQPPTIDATVAFTHIDASGKLKKFKRFTNTLKNLEQHILDTAVSTTDRVLIFVSSVAEKPEVDVVCYGTCVRAVDDALEETWAVSITPEATSSGRIAVGPSGESIAAGPWTLYRPGGGSNDKPGPGHYVVGLDVNGKKRWVRTRSGRPQVDGAAVLGDGTSIVAVSSAGDDPPDTIAVIRAFTPAGSASWTQTLAARRVAEITDITTDGTDLVVIGIGRADRGLKLGDITVPAGIFVARLQPLL